MADGSGRSPAAPTAYSTTHPQPCRPSSPIPKPPHDYVSITSIPGYTTLTAAARDCYNGNDTALRQRVLAIERAAGFPIINRSSTLPTPTEQGREFLREATQILQAAEEADNRS